MHDIPVTRAAAHKPIPQDLKASFGDYFSDHMFQMEYTEGLGWHDPRIVPFGPLQLHPSSSVIQYAQAIFDGSKGYRREDGSIHLFRPQAHIARLNRSAGELCMPAVDPDLVLAAMRQLIDLDRDWVPAKRGNAIYVRQTMVGTEGYMVVRPSRTYTYLIFLCPVGSYYSEGAGPVRILVSETRVRAAKGAIGSAKAGANYAASLKVGREAAAAGFSQVLWLDSVQRRYLEEVGTMNIMVKIGGRIFTPPLSDSILPGITRDSVLKLMRDWAMEVAEAPIDIEDVIAASRTGTLEEMWGVGTAAVISPVGELAWRGEKIVVNGGQTGPVAAKLFEHLTGLHAGTVPDSHGWSVAVD
ncbi:branched-chain amino acid aminotransferase [Mesorhizobium sp. VK25A]|uniref:Probable branched-chain-amino-acid aminotransferase n=1 Tax=Mesorhizobium vachelliae TaxID=3072309 RepID=A0ABU5A8A7_9HYPH|nr:MULTISPECIES: branched-chain amino acid aminotransferase [unclassified Mesorhizobium]MDX8533940.1 branched-chain amino acid aminotransferase [Mesorhizobium sp. VK25D]MDX8546589.1 branched-chain amino acid aminotransferase [Mesorhizobium sp. VK25A]